jgi:hypothetical protein
MKLEFFNETISPWPEPNVHTYRVTYHVSAHSVHIPYGGGRVRLRLAEGPHGVHESVIDVTEGLDMPYESVDMEHIIVGQTHRTD